MQARGVAENRKRDYINGMADIEFQPKNNGVPLWIGGIVLFLIVCWLLGTLRAPEAKPQEPAVSARKAQAPAVKGVKRPVLAVREAKPVPEAPSVLQDAPAQQVSIVVSAASEESYRRLLELARSRGWSTEPLDALRSVRLRLGDAAMPAFIAAKEPEWQLAPDSIVRIPINLTDEYPEWQGNPGPSFGRSFRQYLGVDAADASRGEGVTVALLDMAVHPHAALEGASLTALDPFGIAKRDGERTGEHGTAVASILTGTGGVTNAKVLAYAVLDAEGNGSVFDAAQAIVAAADAGAKVISMSFGSYTPSAVLADAVAYATDKGAVLVAAAGNNGVGEICYPAAYDQVIAVGAVAADGNVAGFSNRGEQLDVVAPGVGLLAAAGENEGIAFSGTSAAVPCVSGILANYLAAHPDTTPEKLRALLEANCNDTGLPGLDEATGYGVPDVERMNRYDEKGIVDVAAGGIELDANGQLIVSLQNTGTVPVTGAKLTAAINGRFYEHTFQGTVAAGDTVAATAPLSVEALTANGQGVLRVQTQVSVPGDQRSRNQSRTRNFDLQEK